MRDRFLLILVCCIEGVLIFLLGLSADHIQWFRLPIGNLCMKTVIVMVTYALLKFIGRNSGGISKNKMKIWPCASFIPGWTAAIAESLWGVNKTDRFMIETVVLIVGLNLGVALCYHVRQHLDLFTRKENTIRAVVVVILLFGLNISLKELSITPQIAELISVYLTVFYYCIIIRKKHLYL